MSLNLKVIKYRKDLTGEKMIRRFQKESETLLRKLKWLSYYKKPSELRKLAKLKKKRKIKKFEEERAFS